MDFECWVTYYTSLVQWQINDLVSRVTPGNPVVRSPPIRAPGD
ncbi:MAG: hypothetical protein JWQ32_1335 [Marmoricola sp.]|nr:hypothetical protein [Marmoricola sp.]